MGLLALGPSPAILLALAPLIDSRLHPVVADKLVYCHEALALHAKLQDAAYRPEPETWDEVSDSDSDKSDDKDEDEQILRLMA